MRTSGHSLLRPDRSVHARTRRPRPIGSIGTAAVLMCATACGSSGASAAVPAATTAAGPTTAAPTAAAPAIETPAIETGPVAPAAARPGSPPSAVPPTPGTGAGPAVAGPQPTRIALPWPAATPVEAVALQHTVDAGAQPWLLDPTEVARAYARALGWARAQVSGGEGASPTRATVATPAGSRTLTLRQAVRTGAGGIWLVTVDSAP